MRDRTQPQKKIFSLKEISLDDAELSGIASGIGTLDQAGDVIFPGFYSDAVIEEFLLQGFVPVGHDWSGLPVAYPTSAKEAGQELQVAWKFHTTQAAMDARTVAKERKDAGLTMGLSVGFSMNADGFKFFKSGKDLLAFAVSAGYDMSLFDVEGITAWKTGCWALLHCAKLYEFSIVAAPCHLAAGVTQAKSLIKSLEKALPETFRNKGELLGGWVEVSALLAALYRVQDALAYGIFDLIYDFYYDDGDDVEGVCALIAGMHDEASDLTTRITRALLTLPTSGSEAAAAEAQQWMGLHAPQTETDLSLLLEAGQEITFSRRLKLLETAVGGVATLASRRQETRAKSGRTHSAATVDALTGIRDGLQTHCDTLSEMLAPAETEDGDDDETEDAEEKALAAKRREQARLALELALLAG